MYHMVMTLSFTVLSLFSLESLHADCLGCIKSHTEHFTNGVTQQSYIKKCLAKQKDLDSEICPGCKCSRLEHSLHRHPYKWHNGKKLVAQPITFTKTNSCAASPNQPNTKPAPLAFNNNSILQPKNRTQASTICRSAIAVNHN